MGCYWQLGLGKGGPLSGPQPERGRSSLPRGSTAAQATEEDSHPQHKNCKYCLGRATWGPEACWDTASPQQISRAPFSGARECRLLRQGILVRKAGWGVQAGGGAGSSAKGCPGTPGPALCHKLTLAQLHRSSLMPRSEPRRTGPAVCSWPCSALGASKSG